MGKMSQLEGKACREAGLIMTVPYLHWLHRVQFQLTAGSTKGPQWVCSRSELYKNKAGWGNPEQNCVFTTTRISSWSGSGVWMRSEKAVWITWIDQHSSHGLKGSSDVIYTFQHNEARKPPKQHLCDKTKGFCRNVTNHKIWRGHSSSNCRLVMFQETVTL